MSTDAHTAIRKTIRGYLVALILVAAGLGCLHLLYSELREARVYWFNLDKERNLPTWLSGMVFFLFGCSALVAWFWERRRNSAGEASFRYPILWIGVATVGWMMSLDEITILHENLWWKEVRLASQELGGGWVFLTQWQILFAPAVLLVVGCFAIFFCNRYSASRAALLAAFGGIGCWITAFILEGLRGAFKWSGSTWYTVEVVLEEELELIGAILLLGSVVFYTLDIALDFSDQRRERLRVATRFLTARAMAALAIALFLLTGGAGIMYLLAHKQASGDMPLPALHERAKRDAAGRDRAAVDDRRSGRPSVPSRDADKIIDPSGPDAAAVRDAITLSADYLVRACKADGQFVYRINLDPRVTPKPKYNVLRHAGTMYALAVYHEHYPDDRTRNALVRAGRFLRERCMAPVPGREDLLAVWSRPQINGSSAPVQAKLGGTGLALVALLSLEKVAPGSTPPQQLRQLGSFVLYM